LCRKVFIYNFVEIIYVFIGFFSVNPYISILIIFMKKWLHKKILNKISLNKEKVKSVLDCLEKLEDDDDVQHVYANLKIDNNFVEKIST